VAGKRLPSEERRKQILVSSLRVFARSSFHGATTRQISEEAGVAEALIYRYFGSKRELFCAAVSYTGERLVESLLKVLEENKSDPRAAMAATVGMYLEFLRRHEDLAKMVFLVSAELDDPEVRAAYMPHLERCLKALTVVFREWQKAGLVREDVAPRAAAWLFVGSYQILALMKHSGSLDEFDPQAALALLNPFLKGPQGTA
jgi:TetR/AcrR family transcriptional regulator